MIKKQMGFYLDSTLCTGCKTCMIACKDKNDLKKGVNWRRVTEYTGGDWMKVGDAYQQNIFSYNLSISCNHCEEPICVENCPTTAMHKDEKTGIVSVNRNKCVGCRYCEWACPYGAPQYNSDLGIMTKCDLCFDYLEKGETPACVAACPNRALHYGEISQLRKKFGKISGVAPLPDPALTSPCLVLKPHRDAEQVGSKAGKISNSEEV